MDPVAAVPARAGVTGDPPASPEKWWIKHVVSIISTLLGSSAILFVLIKAYATDYELRIMQPTREGTSIEVRSADIEIGWLLKPRDTFLRDYDYKAKANILVLKNGRQTMKLQDRYPPTMVSLPDGNGEYVVEIQPAKKADPAFFTVTVQSATPAAP